MIVRLHQLIVYSTSLNLMAYGVECEDGEGAGLGGDAAAECSHHTHLDLALDLLWSSSR